MPFASKFCFYKQWVVELAYYLGKVEEQAGFRQIGMAWISFSTYLPTH